MLTAFLHLIGSWIQLIVFLYTPFSQFFMMSSVLLFMPEEPCYIKDWDL